MEATGKRNQILITGGDTLLGMSIAAVLLAEGTAVTLIIREGGEKRLGELASQVSWSVGDVWDGASLRGKARGHRAVIHTVGSMHEDMSRGLTFNRLNVVSARNAANMCVSDGVSHFVMLSAAAAPWLKGHYVKSKREAEAYVRKIGLKTSIIRAPLIYERGKPRPLFFRIASFVGMIPPLNWLMPGKVAPLPVDVLARGIARIAMQPIQQTKIYHARDLRRLNNSEELRGAHVLLPEPEPQRAEEDILPFETIQTPSPFERR